MLLLSSAAQVILAKSLEGLQGAGRPTRLCPESDPRDHSKHGNNPLLFLNFSLMYATSTTRG